MKLVVDMITYMEDYVSLKGNEVEEDVSKINNMGCKVLEYTRKIIN